MDSDQAGKSDGSAAPAARVDALGIAALGIACVPIAVLILALRDAATREAVLYWIRPLFWIWLTCVPAAFVLGLWALFRGRRRRLPLRGCARVSLVLVGGEVAFVAFVFETFANW